VARWRITWAAKVKATPPPAPISPPSWPKRTQTGWMRSWSTPRAAAPRSRITARCSAPPMQQRLPASRWIFLNCCKSLPCPKAQPRVWPSPITPPAVCNTASRSRPRRKICWSARASLWSNPPTAICAAALRAPTTCCNPRFPRNWKPAKCRRWRRNTPTSSRRVTSAAWCRSALRPACRWCIRLNCSIGLRAGQNLAHSPARWT